ncbi:hypothetical protein [Sphingobacterium multivorum]|uniref:hypothetical protein n=1 Tax=Sphingobacterium multivorum TaxID=28454 RepID=UPI00345EC9A0
MGYLEFNRWSYEYYKTTTLKNGVCCLAIDEYEIEIFKRQYSLDNLYFKEIGLGSWGKLLNFHDYGDMKIPIYFGLIALQCLAASSMENSETVILEEPNEKAIIISSGNFWDRFCRITGIKKQRLLKCYSEEQNGVPIQEILWHSAKKYLENNLKFQLKIPQKTKGPGRYIQYPKFQVVLNKEDLKEIADKVLNQLDISKGISEENFYRSFLNEFPLQRFNRNNNKVKHEGPTRDIFLKQVFNFYNSGEWKFLNHKHITSKPRRKIKYVIEFGLNNIPYFYKDITEILYPYEIFKGGHLFVFEKIDGVEEFEQSSLFSLNTELLIVSSTPLNIGLNIEHPYAGLNIARCIFNKEEEAPFFLRDRLRKNIDEIPVHLKGIRLGHSWQYIQNFGPEIIGVGFLILYSTFSNPKEQVILENYNSLNCDPGIYTVRVPGFTSLQFIVLEQKPIDLNHENRMGLRLTNFRIENTGILLMGLQLFGNSSMVSNIKINDWVRANIGQHFSSKSALLRSIKYKDYD